ncbi:farnesyl pyrophosphate synthase-like [Ostrinia nubilalis]|uniref:farnesyl pyrophosphate synthase-like n=1 Tax=Ostrinia nubilalis TaxID=29057 RepID=UPI00308237EB
MTVTAYQMLEKPDNLCEGSMRQARTLGWCIELLQTCMLLMDDIIDNSTTRRGALCWYRRPDVGTRAVNDTSLLLALIFEQLKINFSEKQYYPDLIRVFNEAVSQISIGQYLDFVAARNINSFNEKNYTNIAVFKTVYYTFKLPVYVSLLLANKSCVDAYKNEKELLKEMGILTLMQNDFLDCFGDEKVVGKAGTDIQEGKCTWLAVQALARGGDAARALLEACYGRADEASARRVRTLYERLRLPQLYRDAEQAARKKILKQIDAIPADNIVPPALIRKLFHMVYHIPM